jgi:hypothetical protein
MKILINSLLLSLLFSCDFNQAFTFKDKTKVVADEVAPTAPTEEEDILEIGDELEGGIYAGITSGYQLITTPGNCSNSATPICDGATDSLTTSRRIWDPDFCSDMEYGGYTDWAYPSIDELNVLFANQSAIGGFNSSGRYWSNVLTYPHYSNQEWAIVNFLDGLQNASWDTENELVRCVRQKPLPIVVIEIGDQHAGGIYAGEISGYQLITTPGNCTDSLTPVCDAGTDSVLINRNIWMPPNYCEAMDYGGFSDWYFPSIAELTQLYDNQAAIGGFDTNGIYWSGDEGGMTDYSAQYWDTLNFQDGVVDQYDEFSGGRLARCVRQQAI